MGSISLLPPLCYPHPVPLNLAETLTIPHRKPPLPHFLMPQPSMPHRKSMQPYGIEQPTISSVSSAYALASSQLMRGTSPMWATMGHVSTPTTKKHTTQCFPSIFLTQRATIDGRDLTDKTTEAIRPSYIYTTTFSLPILPGLSLTRMELWKMGPIARC